MHCMLGSELHYTALNALHCMHCSLCTACIALQFSVRSEVHSLLGTTLLCSELLCTALVSAVLNSLHCSALHCFTLHALFCTAPVQISAEQCWAVQSSIGVHCTAQHHPNLYALHFSGLCRSELLCTALHFLKALPWSSCNTLNSSPLLCTVLQCSALHCPAMNFCALLCTTMHCTAQLA